MKVVGDNVLVDLGKQEEKSGNILLPAVRVRDKGTVIDVGEGGYSEQGIRIPIEVKKGDRVLLHKHYVNTPHWSNFEEIKNSLDKNALIIVKPSHIIAILDENE